MFLSQDRRVMKATLRFLGIWVFAMGNSSHAITVTSCDYHVWGNWQEDWAVGDGESGYVYYSSSDSFNVAGSGSGLSTSVSSGPYGWGSAEVGLSAFHFSMRSDAAPGDLRYPWGIGALSGTFIDTWVTASTTFSVEGSQLAVHLTGNSYFNYSLNEQDMHFALVDLTASSTMISVANMFLEGHWDATYDFNVDPSHEYALQFSGWMAAWDAKEVTMNFDVQLGDSYPPPQSVPDSGSTWLSLAIALSAMWWPGRRRRPAVR